MTGIMTIGLDLAKTVFQVNGADSEGRPVLRKQLRRGQTLYLIVAAQRYTSLQDSVINIPS